MTENCNDFPDMPTETELEKFLTRRSLRDSAPDPAPEALLKQGGDSLSEAEQDALVEGSKAARTISGLIAQCRQIDAEIQRIYRAMAPHIEILKRGGILPDDRLVQSGEGEH